MLYRELKFTFSIVKYINYLMAGSNICKNRFACAFKKQAAPLSSCVSINLSSDSDINHWRSFSRKSLLCLSEKNICANGYTAILFYPILSQIPISRSTSIRHLDYQSVHFPPCTIISFKKPGSVHYKQLHPVRNLHWMILIL
jgi:hypothetical protein